MLRSRVGGPESVRPRQAGAIFCNQYEHQTASLKPQGECQTTGRMFHAAQLRPGGAQGEGEGRVGWRATSLALGEGDGGAGVPPAHAHGALTHGS